MRRHKSEPGGIRPSQGQRAASAQIWTFIPDGLANVPSTAGEPACYHLTDKVVRGHFGAQLLSGNDDWLRYGIA